MGLKGTDQERPPLRVVREGSELVLHMEAPRFFSGKVSVDVDAGLVSVRFPVAMVDQATLERIAAAVAEAQG